MSTARCRRFVVERIGEALNTVKKAINGSRIHLFGVAYKKDVSDMRESPALDVLELLHRRGATLSYTDPYVPKLQHGDIDLCSVPEDKAGDGIDCAVICTNHKVFDYRAHRPALLRSSSTRATRSRGSRPITSSRSRWVRKDPPYGSRDRRLPPTDYRYARLTPASSVISPTIALIGRRAARRPSCTSCVHS